MPLSEMKKELKDVQKELKKADEEDLEKEQE